MMAFLVGICACNSDTLYKSEIVLPEEGWVRTSPVSYDIEIQDTSVFYEMMLDVKAKESYRYQNLYVNIETLFPDGKTEKDIVSLELGTPGGKWHGKCSSGACNVPVQLQQLFKFPQKGQYKISLHQFTRIDTIKDLSSLTLSINKAIEN
jgi:gliding motility-associated lipoprotein GldH